MCKSTTLKNFFYVETSILYILGILSTKTSSVLYKIYSFIVVVCFVTVYPFLLIKDLVTLNFRDALPSWFTFFGFVIITPITLSYYVYQAQINDIFKRMEQEPFLPSPKKMDEVVKHLILKWWRLKNTQAYLFLISMCATVVSQIILSLVLRLINTDSNKWQLEYGEFLNITYSPNFEIVYVYQSFAVFYSAMAASTIIAVIYGFFNYIATQFKIVQHNLTTMLSNAKKSLSQNNVNNSDMYWNALSKEIGKCVVYHIQITKMLKEFEEIFSIAILFFFISYSCTVCFELYRVSIVSWHDTDFYKTVLEGTSLVFATYLINACGENVTHESNQIANTVYEIDFVGTDLRFQKSLVTLMRQSQKPIRVKAGKFIDISLIAYTQVLATL